MPAFMLVIGKGLSPGMFAEALTVMLCLTVGSIAGWLLYLWVENPLLRLLRPNTGR